jgi:hypothetical protein
LVWKLFCSWRRNCWRGNPTNLEPLAGQMGCTLAAVMYNLSINKYLKLSVSFSVIIAVVTSCDRHIRALFSHNSLGEIELRIFIFPILILIFLKIITKHKILFIISDPNRSIIDIIFTNYFIKNGILFILHRPHYSISNWLIYLIIINIKRSLLLDLVLLLLFDWHVVPIQVVLWLAYTLLLLCDHHLLI